MLKPLLFLLLASQVLFSQEKKDPVTYKFGHNGMELIVKNNAETIIINTFNSKVAIKEEIAEKIYSLFQNNAINSGESLVVDGTKAKVKGLCYITQKGHLTSIDFYYNTVEWNSGITEVYTKSL